MFKRKARTRLASRRFDDWQQRLHHLDDEHDGDRTWQRRRAKLTRGVERAGTHLDRMQRSKRLRWRRAHWRWEKAGAKVEAALHREQ